MNKKNKLHWALCVLACGGPALPVPVRVWKLAAQLVTPPDGENRAPRTVPPAIIVAPTPNTPAVDATRSPAAQRERLGGPKTRKKWRPL